MVASGNEVGKISIRVVPNLDDFREDLRKALEDEEKKQLESKVKADTDDYEEGIDKANKKASDTSKVAPGFDGSKYTKEYEKATKNLPTPDPPDTDLKVNLDRFKRRYKSKFQAMIADFESNIPLTADGELIRNSLKRLEDEFDGKLALLDPGKDINTLVRLRRQVEKFYRDTREDAPELLGKNVSQQTKQQLKSLSELTKFGADLAVQMVEFDKAVAESKAKSDRIWSDVDYRLRISVDDGEIAKVRRSLADRVVVPVSLQAKFDKGGFTRRAAIAVAGAKELTSAAAKQLGFLAQLPLAVGRAFSRLGPEVVALTALISALLVPALALVSGALVAMPGLLTAFAVPIAAVALGVDGIKKAAEAAKPAFDKLKETMSKTFQDGMTPGFQTLADKLFPRLQAALPKVAESLSGLFDTFTNTLTTNGNLDKIEGTIRGIAAALSRAEPGVASFTNAFTSLINATAGPMLSSLSGTINKLGGEFEAWVGKVTANGQLQQAMDTLKGTLGEIGGIVKDMAAFGFDALADPQFGASMKGFVQDARELVNMILPLLKSGFEDVASAVSGIVDTFEQIRGAAGWITDLLGKFDKLTGAAQGAGEVKDYGGFMGLGGKDGVFGDKAPFRQWFGDAPKAAAEAGTEAGKQFQQNLSAAAAATQGDAGALTDAINNQLTSAIDVSKEAQKAALQSAFTGTGVTDAVKAQIGTQMTGIITEAQAAVTQLGPVLQQGIDQAVLPLSTLPAKVGEAFATLGPSITGAWAVVTQTVQAGVDQMTTAISTAFNTLPQTATTAFQGVQQSITGAFGFMVLSIGQQAGNINTAVQQAFNQIPQTIASALGQAVQVTASTAGEIVTAFQAALQQLPALVQQTFTPMVQVVTDTMNQLVAAVVSGGAQVVAEVQTWPGRIQSILQGLASTASASGAAVGREFAAGIASQSGAVAAAAQQLVEAARKFFPNSPAETGPFSGSGWVDKSGEAVGEGFASGLSSSQQEVVATARALMQAVKDIFGSAEGLTLNFNMGPVTQQAEAATKQVRVFGDTLSKVPTGPLKDLAAASGNGLSAADSKAQRDELSQQLDLLEIERKQLELEKGRAGANNDAIKARLAEIKEQKLQLGLQKDQLDYAKKYGAEVDGSSSKMDDAYKNLSQTALQMPLDFAKTTRDAFLSDIGISGGGALGAIMDYGLDYGSQFIFNVSNVQEALTVKANQLAKQGTGMVGR